MNLSDAARQYLEWGFVPLPVRDYLKFPAHLRISGLSFADLHELSRTTQSWDSATGVWLLLAEPDRGDGYVHVAVDLDELPALSSMPPDVQELFRDYAFNTLAYWTARGAHFHFLIPADDVPVRKRMVQAYATGDNGGNKHLFDLFVFAPPDDRSYADGWRRGVLAYPSAAYDTHAETDPKPIVERRLIGPELKPPLKITWAELSEFLHRLFGDYSFGRPVRTPNIGHVRTAQAHDAYVKVSQRLDSSVADAVRLLSRYPCAAAVLPRVSPDGDVVAKPERVIPEGSRNNGLFGILSLYNYLRDGEASPEVVHALAKVVNTYTLSPPLSGAEVVRVVMSVVGGGYTMKPATFAEHYGLTDACDTCPLRDICRGDDGILAPAVPELEEIPSDGDAWFAKRAFRSEQQMKMYIQLREALSKPSNRIVLGLAPTGSGKTVHAASLAKYAVDVWKSSVVVLVPTKQLQNQHRFTLANHDKGQVPHVVFKGRRNFRCPFLDLAKRIAEEKGYDVHFEEQPTAQDAPCAYHNGVACGSVLSAYARLQEQERRMIGADSDDKAMKKARKLLEGFEMAVGLALAKYTDNIASFSEWKKDVLTQFYTTPAEQWRCEYKDMVRTVLKYAAGLPPGVIVANKSLVWVLHRVASQHAAKGKTALAIVDEAHELLDALVTKYRLKYADVSDDTPPTVAITYEIQKIQEELSAAMAESERLERERNKPSAARTGGDVLRRLRRLAKSITRLNRDLQNAQMYREMVMAHPDAFVLVRKDGKQYIYPLRNHRAEVLRAYLTKLFPSMKFVLLTATGSSLERTADVVVRADSVIPVTNRMIIYEPIQNLSAKKLGPRFVEVYLHRVVDHIVARYGFFAPELARLLGQQRIRAIVHESRKERAILLAYGLWKRGHRVLLYAGNREDWSRMDKFVERFAEEILRANGAGDDVVVCYSLEDVVRRFKEEKGFDFLVSVALGTGHDFDEDDVALQFIVKVPYPQLNSTEYTLIEKNDGPEARDKQYIYDTLMALIQAAGRTTRKPSQKSVTIVLDRGFLTLLRRAWDAGFRDEVLDLARRVWCPSVESESVRRVLPPQVASVFLTTPTDF